MDVFHEEVVVKNNTSLQSAMYIMSIIIMVLCGAYALIMINPLIFIISSEGFSAAIIPDIVIFLMSIASCVLIFLNKDKIKTEYEYTFTNGILDFAKVFNNRKRKNLGSMNVRNVEACGLVSSGSFKRFSGMQGVKITNWFLNRDSELFYFYFVKGNEKQMIVIEPSEHLRNMIIKFAGQGKYQVN
ncbi:MAG: hypothetical protein GX337_08940 [Christensenellaceae bacterium]|nr:hypothetical protein [Christensenellaceae bacterium]